MATEKEIKQMAQETIRKSDALKARGISLMPQFQGYFGVQAKNDEDAKRIVGHIAHRVSEIEKELCAMGYTCKLTLAKMNPSFWGGANKE